MKKLNPELTELYNFLTEFINMHGFAPSYREIQSALGYKSISMVKPKLLELEQLDKIKINNYKSRAIEIKTLKNDTPKHADCITFENINECSAIKDFQYHSVSISKTLLPSINSHSNCFVLKMIGSSMTDAGINDGDFVLIKSQNTAKTNDIVYALIEDEFTTIKKYIKKGEKITLLPENKSMKAIFPKKIEILGVIVGCLKLSFNNGKN